MATHHVSYTDFLRTKSELRMLDSEKREKMLREIAKAIDDHGATLTMDYATQLYIARRLAPDRIARCERP